MSEPSDSLVQQGKVNQPSTEGQSHTLREEDESSITKVLGWVGMVSRYSGKRNKSPGFQEEQDRQGPEGHVTPDTENAPRIQPEIQTETSTLLRIGLPGFFLRKTTRVETSENVLVEVEADDVCQLDGKRGNINLRCSAQNAASGLNFTTVEFEENSMIEKERARLYQGEVSQNRLASLVSFWESGSKGMKVLKFKKSETNDDKLSDQKIPKVTFNLSPSEANKIEYTDICESCKGFSESHNGTRHDNISVLPSVGEKMSSYDTVQLPTKQMDDISAYERKEIYSPILSVRKAITEQDAISDPKRCWEREKCMPKIIISTPDCMPKSYSQQGLNISTRRNGGEIPETSSSSLNRELSEIKTSSKGKLNPISRRVSVNSPLDDTDRTPYNESLFKTRMLGSGESTKISPVSYPIRNFTSVSQDHIDQSKGDTVTILEQSRTLSSRHMTKVKESRMAGCPLRVFPINISPTKKTPLRDMEHTPTGQHTSYTSTKESSPGNDDILLAERPEKHLLSFAGNTSERIIHYQPTSPHSPPCFGRSQAPGTVRTGNINSKQTSQAHSFPVSQSQTSVQLITSPETTNKRPVVLTEQMQLDDLQCRTSSRSSVHLSCQHHPNIESTHVSHTFTHQPDQQKRAGERVYESSERMSLSLQSHPQSEITFSSSPSTGSWSLFQTSSACEH